MCTLKFLPEAMLYLYWNLQLTQGDPWQVSEKVYFMKQTVGNACGTIGLLHAVGNLACSSLVDLGMLFARHPTSVFFKDSRVMRLCVRWYGCLVLLALVFKCDFQSTVYLGCRGRLLSAALCQANVYYVS